MFTFFWNVIDATKMCVLDFTPRRFNLVADKNNWTKT